MTLKEEMEKFLHDQLFEVPEVLLKEFRSRFGQHAQMFVDIPDKPKDNPVDTFLVVNGTEVIAEVRGVRAELQSR